MTRLPSAAVALARVRIKRRLRRAGIPVDGNISTGALIRLVMTLLAVGLLAGCDLQALSPGDRCWWRYSAPAFRYDTVWNQVPAASVPDSVRALWSPYLLVGRQVWTDSVRTCR